MKYLEKDYALKQLCNWAAEKFNIEVDPEELIGDQSRRDPKPAEKLASPRRRLSAIPPFGPCVGARSPIWVHCHVSRAVLFMR